jgi:5-methylcytosine-specific restriction endonuclease McrA
MALKQKHDRKSLIGKGDAGCRQIAKSRAGGKCEYGGCRELGTECHHIISRRHMATRFLPENLILLCADHHRFAHAHREDFMTVLWLDFGNTINKLTELSKVIVHFKNADLQEIIERLKRHGE